MENDQKKEKQKFEKDRFYYVQQGYKEQHQPDWLDDENKIYINKLNFVAKHFEQVYNNTKQLKQTVFDVHSLKIEDYEMKLREMSLDFNIYKSKVGTIENSLPNMIREMVDYYIEVKLAPQIENFVNKDQFKEQMSLKLDFNYFNAYLKKKLNDEQRDLQDLKNQERFYNIEKKLETLVDLGEFHKTMNQKVSNHKFDEMVENMQKLQNVQNRTLEKHQDEIQRLDNDHSESIEQLKKLFKELDEKVREYDVEEVNGKDNLDSESSEEHEQVKKDTNTFDDSRADDEFESKNKLLKKLKRDDESSKVDLPDSTIKLKRKNDLLSQFEAKLEDLRKMAFNEINRLEVIFEQEQTQNQKQFQNIENKIKSENGILSEKHENTSKFVDQIYKYVTNLQEYKKSSCKDISYLKERDSAIEINNIKRKLVQEILVDLLTPIKQNMSVELKASRKLQEEQIKLMNKLTDQYMQQQNMIDQINQHSIKTIKNLNMENQIMDQEIDRMKKIDRIKVSFANDIFLNQDKNIILPSISRCQISKSTLNKNLAKDQSKFFNFSELSQVEMSKSKANLVTESDTATQNDILGIFNRHNKKPSKRERILIARSLDFSNQDFHSKPKIKSNLSQVNNSNQKFQSVSQFTSQKEINENKFIQESNMEGKVMRSPFSQKNILIQDNFLQGTNKNQISNSVQKLDQIFELSTNSEHIENRQSNQYSQNKILENFNKKGQLFVDVQHVDIPDAMARIRQKINEQKRVDVKKKLKVAEFMEQQREQILDKYKLSNLK